jgi:hypothetical protein
MPTIDQRAQYELEHASPDERQRVVHALATVARINETGKTLLAEHLSLGPFLMDLSVKACRITGSNSRVGSAYNGAMRALWRKAGFDVDDKQMTQNFTAILYIYSVDDDHENEPGIRRRILEEELAKMSDTRRGNINSPHAARKIIDGVLKDLKPKASDADAEPLRLLPPLKAENAELKRTVADLEERLAAADVGGHIDLDRSIEQCADGIIWHALTKTTGLDRAERLARCILERVKQERAKRKQQANTEGEQQ